MQGTAAFCPAGHQMHHIDLTVSDACLALVFSTVASNIHFLDPSTIISQDQPNPGGYS